MQRLGRLLRRRPPAVWKAEIERATHCRSLQTWAASVVWWHYVDRHDWDWSEFQTGMVDRYWMHNRNALHKHKHLMNVLERVGLPHPNAWRLARKKV